MLWCVWSIVAVWERPPLGLLAMVQPLLVAWSLQYATVGQIAPFRYTSVVVAAGIDWLVWNQLSPWTSTFGLVLIAIGAPVILTTRHSASHAESKKQNV
jgi:drug/metabolite transporter (DMT)-like permease